MSDDSGRILVELTSSAVQGEAGLRNLDACRRRAETLGFDFGIQLHNTASAAEIEALSREAVRLSAHGPLNARYNWNLAGEDVSAVFASIAENVALFQRLGIRDTVFHGFFMTDLPVPAFGHGRSYDDCMSEIIRPELLRSESRLNLPFRNTAEFLARRERVKERLAQLAALYPEIRFRIESDFPAYGAANNLPEDMVALAAPLCLDTGHMWMSAKLFGVDFIAMAEQALAGGGVTMVHFHASKWDDATPMDQWGDGHLPLRRPNRMNLPRFARACRDAGVRDFVLEIPKATPDDLEALAEFLA